MLSGQVKLLVLFGKFAGTCEPGLRFAKAPHMAQRRSLGCIAFTKGLMP
jgi:hypothetical protein